MVRKLLVDVIDSFDVDKLVNLRIIMAVWQLDPELMESQVGGSDQSLLDVSLKRILKLGRDPQLSIRLPALAMVFGLLSELATAKNAQSPSLYKLLTFSFIENFEDTETRELMTLSFIELFDAHRSIPVAILLDPLLRKLQQEQMEKEVVPDRPGLMHFDRQLLRCFIQHRKLKLESAPPLGYGGCGLDLADFLAEIIIKDPSEAIHAVVLLSELYSRFQAFDAMHDFACKFIEICLKEYLRLMLNVPKSLHSYANTSFKTDTSMRREHEVEELDFRIKAGCLLKMISYFVEECAHERRQ